jgi:peroxiredoxin
MIQGVAMYLRAKATTPVVRYGCATLLMALLVMVGQPLRATEQAPAFEIPTAMGTTTLSDLHGQVVYLDFWASWCKPCLQSFPWMNAMQERYAAQGFRVIAVNVDKERGLADEFLRKVPANFTIVYDPEGELASRYQLIGMPSTFLITRDGSIHQRHVGFLLSKQKHYEAEIRQLLAEYPIASVGPTAQ